MDLLSPQALPGVGMGDLTSVAAVGGLIGLAVTSGALMLCRVPGIVMYAIAALAVLAGKGHEYGDQPALALVVLGVIVVIAAVGELTGRQPIRWSAAVAAGAAVGFAWAEWNESPMALGDPESWIGLSIGVAGALVGAWAADLFVSGAVRAGGHALIVGSAAMLVVFVLNALSLYVPLVGFAVLISAVVIALRLRRRSSEKYKGLRILS